MCSIQSLTYVVMATGLSLFDNAMSYKMLLEGSLRGFCSLSAEVAAVLHPQTHRKKSGLCLRESADLVLCTVP